MKIADTSHLTVSFLFTLGEIIGESRILYVVNLGSYYLVRWSYNLSHGLYEPRSCIFATIVFNLDWELIGAYTDDYSGMTNMKVVPLKYKMYYKLPDNLRVKLALLEGEMFV